MNIEEWSGYEVSDLVLEQAATWIAALDSKDLQEAQQVAFYQWLQSHPSHQHAYLELSELWAKSSCIKSMQHLIEKSKVVSFPTQTSSLETHPEPPPPLASPAWAYSLAIGLIFIGLSLPVLQNLV